MYCKRLVVTSVLVLAATIAFPQNKKGNTTSSPAVPAHTVR